MQQSLSNEEDSGEGHIAFVETSDIVVLERQNENRLKEGYPEIRRPWYRYPAGEAIPHDHRIE